MPRILAVGTALPQHAVTQEAAKALTRHLFQNAYSDIDRLLAVFANSQIETRHFCVPLEWFAEEHAFAEKNRLFLEHAVNLCEQAIRRCLSQADCDVREVDCLVMVSSTGIATPSLDARLLNRLGLREDLVRMPLWGLGCCGGAMGLSRAADYARAYPSALVLLVSVELCGLVFIKDDHSKSNLIATSLFADGAAAVLVAGDQVPAGRIPPKAPSLIRSSSTTWPDTLDVMGWDLTDDGLKVIFSRDIPSIVKEHMRENVTAFLEADGLSPKQVQHYLLHPGGAKVLTAYREALDLPADATRPAEEVLSACGNMSSATVLFVLERSLAAGWQSGDRGLMAALGPGFSSELLLLHLE